MKCTATKRDGAPCSAAALTGDTKCHFHSAAAWQKRKAAQQNGGLVTAGKIKQLIPTHLQNSIPDLKLDSPQDAKTALEKTLNWVLKGAISSTTATAVTNCLSVFVRLVEATEVDAKIRELEERLKPAA